jgi:3-oxoacyl-[acyl-carrier protein] reductase
METGIRGRCALVNGASAGMGRAAAESLAAEGVDLVLSARGAARLEETARDLRARFGVRVTAVAADHSTTEGRKLILDSCPNPDILVATCSPPPMTPDHRLITPEQWQASLETGLMSPVFFMEAVLPGMVQRRWGRIVNIATIAAKYPLELRILSGAPRAALVN